MENKGQTTNGKQAPGTVITTTIDELNKAATPTAPKTGDVPHKVTIEGLNDQNGQPLVLFAMPKTFSTGSKGFYATAKGVDPQNPNNKYQIGMNITLIGSKPISK
jgi:hypothetical protein